MNLEFLRLSTHHPDRSSPSTSLRSARSPLLDKEGSKNSSPAKGRSSRLAGWEGFRFRNSLRLLPALIFLGAFSHASANDDWGSSHNLLIKKSLGDDWFVLSRSNLAFRRDNEQLFLGYTGVSLGYQLNKQWSARLGFRQAYFKIGDDWREEQRPMAEVYYAKMHEGFRFTSRSRAEFRYRDWSSDDVRLRQEFTITAPWKFTPLELKPYIANETFYSTRNDWIEANWSDLGFSFFPWKGAKVKIGYRFNRLRIRGELTNRHTLVTGLNLFF